MHFAVIVLPEQVNKLGRTNSMGSGDSQRAVEIADDMSLFWDDISLNDNKIPGAQLGCDASRNDGHVEYLAVLTIQTSFHHLPACPRKHFMVPL